MLPILWHRHGKDLNFLPHYLLWKISSEKLLSMQRLSCILFCMKYHTLSCRTHFKHSSLVCKFCSGLCPKQWHSDVYQPTQMGSSIFAFWSTGIQGDPEASVFKSEWQSNVSDSASTKWRFQLKEYIRRERPGWRGKTRMKRKKEWHQRTWVHEVIQAGNQSESCFSHCENGGKQ